MKTTSGEIETVINPPRSIKLDVCTYCQLRCPICSRLQKNFILGQGYITNENFARFLDKNPFIRKAELSNQGEVFLNPELSDILESAFARNVEISINGGTNLNQASDEALEALVNFKIDRLRCSIDGVTQKTYSRYRVGGNLETVVENIQKINGYKKQFRSSRPRLIWQFIVFGHNEHEIERARLLANLLGMRFVIKLNKDPFFMPVKDRDRMRGILGYADRNEYQERFKRSYVGNACRALWKGPQINWDGKLLGCRCNTWGHFAENVFEGNLMAHLNNNKMQYARQMLMGKKPPREDIPCVRCHVYQTMVQYGKWIFSLPGRPVR